MVKIFLIFILLIVQLSQLESFQGTYQVKWMNTKDVVSNNRAKTELSANINNVDKPFPSIQTIFGSQAGVGSTSTADRIDSVKAGVVSAVGGSIGVVPIAIFTGLFSEFDASWEFNHDALVVSLLLFGIVYRYAVRTDQNPQLKLGVVGAFAVVRALNLIDIPDLCDSVPLNCGPPFFLFTPSMLLSGVEYLFESLSAFGGAAYSLEICFYKNILARFQK